MRHAECGGPTIWPRTYLLLNYKNISLDVEHPFDQLKALCRLITASKLLGPEVLEDATALVVICPELFLHLAEMLKGTEAAFMKDSCKEAQQLIACILNAELLAEAVPTEEEKQRLLIKTISDYGQLLK